MTHKEQESYENLISVGFTDAQAVTLIDLIYQVFRFNVLDRTEKLIAAGFTEEQAKVLIEVTYRAKGWELP